MSAVDAAEIALAATEFALYLPDTCSLQTGAPVRDNAGSVWTVSSTQTGVACKLADLSQRERLLAQQLGWEVTAKVRLALSQAVTIHQRIVTGGRTYQVMATNLDYAWRVQTLAYVKLVSGT